MKNGNRRPSAGKLHEAVIAFKVAARAHEAQSKAAMIVAREAKRAAIAMQRQAIYVEQAVHKLIDVDTLVRLNGRRLKKMHDELQIIKKKLGME